MRVLGPHQTIIEGLVSAQEELGDLPFPDLVRQVTGHEVLPYDPHDEVVQEVIRAIDRAADGALAFLNQPASPAREKRRINEVSVLVESVLLEHLAQEPVLDCDIPPDPQGKQRRTGYPDLRILHRPSGRVVYLDPKLYEADSETSTLRTFYFKPNAETSKIGESAHHWLLGFRHDGRTREWRFDRWQLIDLHGFQIGLKVEFQGSNKDLYRPGLTIQNSDPQNLE